jgi:general secretion pathway protein N
MRRALFVVAALAIVAIAVVALAPATLAGPCVERASRGAVVLADAEGTLWHGRGTLVAGAARLPFGWTLDPWPLLRGALRVSLLPFDAGASTPRGEIELRPHALAIRGLDVEAPATALASMAPRPGVAILGDVRMGAPSLRWTPMAFEGGARVEWRHARFTISVEAPIELGTVTAALAADGGRLAGPLTNEGGDFDVRGAVSIAATGSPDVSLTMTPRNGDAAQIRSLSVVAPADGRGWSFDYRVGRR